MVSEKTLELNVSENLINKIRQQGRSFSRAFLSGFTTRYERDTGLDCSIQLPAHVKFVLALQYKRGKRLPFNTWVFKINNNRRNDQHLILRKTAYKLGENSVYYVFPLIDDSILLNSSPNFLKHVRFARVVDFPEWTFNRTFRKPYRVYIEENAGYAIVSSSEEGEVRLLKVDELIGNISENLIKPRLVGELVEKPLDEKTLRDRLVKDGIVEEVIEKILSLKWEHKFLSGVFLL